MKLARLLQHLFLAMAVVLSASCGAEVGSDSASETSEAAPHEPAAATSADPHQGKGILRCETCHTADDHANAAWKERAKALGHDVKGALAERTTCKCCHLGEVKGFGDPFEKRCFGCHGDMKVTIPKMAGAHCLACHGDSTGNIDVRDKAWECQACHAEQQGHEAAIVVHGSEDCSSCHRPHTEPWVKARDCRDCHGEAANHGKAFSGDKLACSLCHKPHEAAGEADGRCASCHQKNDPKVPPTALFGDSKDTGHNACTNCHAPHGADASQAKTCESCHSDVHTMSVGAIGDKAHGTCTNCHDSHDVRKPSDCATCHSSLPVDHPPPGDNGHTCTGCHTVHPKEANTPMAAACESCHQTIVAKGPVHGINQCVDCHAPHDASQGEPACCACHGARQRETLGGAHADCGRCHTAHNPRSDLPTCASCHATESETAPAGHAKCSACHDTHRANVPAANACATCHQDRTQGPHHTAKTPCTSCHRAHGPEGVASPPACSTCHAVGKLPSLHQVTKHQTCESCHTSHEGPRADRATCLTCHTDREKHEPTAKRCDGCHTFAPTR